MSKKALHLTIIVFVVLGLAILMFFPLGIASMFIGVSCLVLAWFLATKTERREEWRENVRKDV